MYANHYRYALTWLRQNGQVLKTSPVQPDLGALAYWAEFQALRQECIAPGSAITTTIEPVWSQQAEIRCLSALKLRVEAGTRPLILETPISWFDPLARLGSSALVSEGLLQAGEIFNYFVTAAPLEKTADGSGATVRAIEPVIDLVQRPLAGRLEASAFEGVGDELDVPVILPESVLDQTGELTRAAGAYETGGILIGDICRDPDTRQLYIDVTAQIPAMHTRSELTQLTFTPETWTNVQDVLISRGRNELMQGWWHSHSYMKETCKDCSKIQNGQCNVNAAFMSNEDVALHRTTFPRAYSLALVVGDGPCSGMTRSLFGWRYGAVAPRGYHVESDRSAVAVGAGQEARAD